MSRLCIKCGFCLAVLLLVSEVISQAPTRLPKDQPNKVERLETTSYDVRSNMRRVQASFVETNDADCFRLAFVATVTEVRPYNEADKLIGKLDDGETDVAVLVVRVVGLPVQPILKESKTIVCPVGNSRDLWMRLHEQRQEVLFEFIRIGKREYVLKFGC